MNWMPLKRNWRLRLEISDRLMSKESGPPRGPGFGLPSVGPSYEVGHGDQRRP